MLGGGGGGGDLRRKRNIYILPVCTSIGMAGELGVGKEIPIVSNSIPSRFQYWRYIGTLNEGIKMEVK